MLHIYNIIALITTLLETVYLSLVINYVFGLHDFYINICSHIHVQLCLCMWLQHYYIYSPTQYMLNALMTSKWKKSERSIKNGKKNELTFELDKGHRTMTNKTKPHRGLKWWATQTPSKNIDVPIFSRTVISSFSYKVPVRFAKFHDCDGLTENIYLHNLPTFTQTCVFLRVITHFFLAGQGFGQHASSC
jgi:hypothetical protein